MIKREDFYGILKDTIESYCSEVRDKRASVSFIFEDGKENFRVYKLGGIVSRPNKSRGALEFLLAEYNIRTNWLKYLAGKVLSYLVYYMRSFGAVKDIFISEGVFGHNELISPQNRSIRFFNYDTRTVDCIIKKGFTDKYFKNQLDFRKKYNYEFMVPLLASGDNWFREPILKGHPLARVTDDRLYDKGIEDTMRNISMLVSDTLEYRDNKSYIAALVEKAVSLTQIARKDKAISSFDKCMRLINTAKKEALSTDVQVPMAMSHGDLQTGNIWCNNDGKVFIYDWETSGLRSVWYDSATLLYSLRRPYGWKQFYENPNPNKVLHCDPNKKRILEEYQVIKSIILLEDYLFLIEDMLELPQTWGNDIFDENIDRIYNVVFG